MLKSHYHHQIKAISRMYKIIYLFIISMYYPFVNLFICVFMCCVKLILKCILRDNYVMKCCILCIFF